MAFKFEDIGDLSYVKKITLDISGGVSHKFISAKQLDTATRYLEISITENDVPIEIPADVTPRIRATKPDKNCILNDGIIHEGLIYIELSQQILAVPGIVQCDIGLYRNERVLSTVTFFIDVALRPLDESKIKSTDEFLSLNKMVSQAQAAAKEAADSLSELKEGIESGDFDGDSGVYVGTEEPTQEKVVVWINPDGKPTEIPDGTGGGSGADGFSPVVEISETDGGHIVAVTDAQGTKSFTVLNGKDGAKGETGADGYTPQKGVDYWTDEDKAELGVDIIPNYVITAAEAVAKTVHRRQSKNSIVFPFIADAHCGWYLDTEHKAVKHLGQALKIIQKRCPLDFVVHGGDFTTGAFSTTLDDIFNDIEEYTELVAGLTNGTEIWLTGNHDDAPYQATENRLTQTDTFALVGRRNLRSGAVCNQGVNYGYLDFENRKLRIIYLDTDDKRSWGSVKVDSGTCDYSNAHHISAEQLRWLATTALDFSDKDDAAKWGVIVFSHVPLTVSGTFTDTTSGQTREYSTANGAAVLGAYRKGLSGSITVNGNVIDYDFTTLEKRANIYCFVHGHDHAYSEGTYEGILSIGCPNAMNGREKQSADGTTYTKTEDTAADTSFCIITVDRENDKIYADHYGAGYDREWDYIPYSGAPYTNQLPISTDTDGNIYNGIGYKSGYRLNSSGGETALEGVYSTGFIPCKKGDIVRLKNVQYVYDSANSFTTNQKFVIYDANKNYIGTTHAGVIHSEWDSANDGTSLTQFTIADTSYGFVADNAAYMRMTAVYLGDDSVITVNELIE